jgi:hypothetical protein
MWPGFAVTSFSTGSAILAELAETEFSAFLSALALEGRVAGSTQNQALSALLFLYKEVLQRELAFIGGVVRVKRPPKRCLDHWWTSNRTAILR